MFIKEELTKIIKESCSFREVARKIGKPNQHTECKKWAKQYKIDYSHFMHGKMHTNLIKNKINMLTVDSVRKVGSRWFATCTCDCGNVNEFRCDALKGGSISLVVVMLKINGIWCVKIIQR